MTPDPEFTRDFTKRFIEMYKIDTRRARACLVAAFMSCYGFVSVADRQTLFLMFMMMAAKIGEEKFEDGMDFVSFLQETSFTTEEQK